MMPDIRLDASVRPCIDGVIEHGANGPRCRAEEIAMPDGAAGPNAPLLRVGGLAVSAERALTLLPVASALLAGCDRLAALDLAGAAGCGPASGSDGLRR
jgi:hypothetical protein